MNEEADMVEDDANKPENNRTFTSSTASPAKPHDRADVPVQSPQPLVTPPTALEKTKAVTNISGRSSCILDKQTHPGKESPRGKGNQEKSQSSGRSKDKVDKQKNHATYQFVYESKEDKEEPIVEVDVNKSTTSTHIIMLKPPKMNLAGFGGLNDLNSEDEGIKYN